jgi:uncharacterized protein (TIGR01777 family)
MVMLLTLSVISSSRSALAFTCRKGAISSSNSNSNSRLAASFFDNLQKAFSTQTQTAEKMNSLSKFYTVGITGSSGLLGSALIDELTKQGSFNGKPIRIVKLSRSDSVSDSKLQDEPMLTLPWNPQGDTPESVLDPEALSSIDTVVHLAGENVATGLGPLGFLGLRPWTDQKKAEIINSRVGPTKAIAKAIAVCKTPTTFLSASGVGVYGDKFIGELSPMADESTDVSTTPGFLAQVSREWEGATKDAGKTNRVFNARMGVVLSKSGGALAKLFPIFFLGGGGNIGDGQQYFSFVSARDAARAFVHIMNTPSLTGPVNVCAPFPCTNAEFTSAMGSVLNRPTILPLPGFAVSALFGEMGEEILLGGVRAVPGKLEKSGFQFLHPTIKEALESAVQETI